MTDRARPGHSTGMASLAMPALGVFGASSGERRSDPPELHGEVSGARPMPRPSFGSVYDAYFDFVWRSVRRLGAPEHVVDDVVQDVFLVVHRRLDDFEGRSSLKTWLFGIALRVVRDHRRALARRRSCEPLRDSLPGCPTTTPEATAERAEAAATLHAILDAMDDDKRAVFVMAELEQMSVPEIADATSENLNTIYSRLRAARADFEEGVRRHRARDAWRQR